MNKDLVKDNFRVVIEEIEGHNFYTVYYRFGAGENWKGILEHRNRIDMYNLFLLLEDCSLIN